MTDKFEIGEVAIYVRPGSPSFGVELTVCSKQLVFSAIDDRTGKRVRSIGYQVDCPQLDSKFRWFANAKHLRKKPRPPERQELGEWDLCPWRPEKVDAKPSQCQEG